MKLLKLFFKCLLNPITWSILTTLILGAGLVFYKLHLDVMKKQLEVKQWPDEQQKFFERARALADYYFLQTWRESLDSGQEFKKWRKKNGDILIAAGYTSEDIDKWLKVDGTETLNLFDKKGTEHDAEKLEKVQETLVKTAPQTAAKVERLVKQLREKGDSYVVIDQDLDLSSAEELSARARELLGIDKIYLYRTVGSDYRFDVVIAVRITQKEAEEMKRKAEQKGFKNVEIHP